MCLPESYFTYRKVITSRTKRIKILNAAIVFGCKIFRHLDGVKKFRSRKKVSIPEHLPISSEESLMSISAFKLFRPAYHFNS
jgi:hypothetical protein